MRKLQAILGAFSARADNVLITDYLTDESLAMALKRFNPGVGPAALQ
jgi:DNA-binding transcriptional regulator LsrR (DeoR family)